MTNTQHNENANADVRMRGFAHRSTVTEVLDWLDAQIPAAECEAVSLSAAAGRVLSADIVSGCDVPGFERSMMDGYAVVAANTSGASAYNRLRLRVVGESLPGRPSSEPVSDGSAVRIMTGAPLPPGADAVLPAEYAEAADNSPSPEEDIWAQGEVSPGKNVGRVGEDIPQNTVIFNAQRRLRPQDIGVLSSVGVAQVDVVRQPIVRIVVTGDELLAAGSKPSGYCITDANGPMLQALCERDGGVVLNPGIIPDQPDSIRTALHEDADVIIVSGGSSVGMEDHAPVLLAQDGKLRFHGIAMRPSSPTGLGRLDHRLVFLLPGNPVSCLCAYDFFAGRAIRMLGGRSGDWPYPKTRRKLQRKLVSTIGRVDYARVRFVEQEVEPIAVSGASVLSSTTRADGFVVIPADSEGYAAGSPVDVYLYDQTD